MILIKTELFYLFLTTLFCGLLWIPYVTERFFRFGIKNTCGYKDNTINIPNWAISAKSAHLNLIINTNYHLHILAKKISLYFKN